MGSNKKGKRKIEKKERGGRKKRQEKRKGKKKGRLHHIRCSKRK